MAKIELEMKAHTQGAVQNLKATQANINKVADAFVNLQNEGKNMSSMGDAVSGFYELIDRLASSMFASGEAASYFEAKMKVVESALQSASQMNNGDMSQVADVLRSMYTEAENASFAINDMTDAEMELAEDAEDTNKVLTKQGSKLLDVAKNILKFQLLTQPITALIRGFKDTLSESVEVAAEAEQTYSKLSTVFEGLASATDKADELARKIGTSSTTAAGALSTVGDLLQAQGMTAAESLSTATEWVKKFQDIIAFKDLDMSLEEFAQSFMSGAAGNLRNFRTFGSIVKESAVNARLAKDGLDKLTGTQLELAKMTTRATLALEQQANADKATEREWESMLSIQRRMEEQSKRLKENLGEYMNTALKPVESAWGRILKSINDTIEAQRTLSSMSGGSGWKDFVNKLLTGMAESDYGSTAIQYGVKMHPKTGGFTDSEVGDLISVGRNIYGFSDETITKVLTGLSDYAVSLDQLSTAFENVDKDAARKLADEAAQAEKERIKSVYEAFVESLEALGLTIFGASVPTDMEDLRDYAGIDLSDVFGDLKVTGFDEFADQISVALGNDTTVDSMKAKQSAWASLYEIARNFFIANNEDHKLTQDNLDLLEKIKGEYQGINDQVQTYQNNLSAIDNYNKSASDYLKQAEQMGMTDSEKTLYDLYTALGNAEKDSELYNSINATIEAFNKLQEAVKKRTEQEERTRRLDNANADRASTIADLYSQKNSLNDSIALQMRQLYMTDGEKELDNIDILIEKARELNNIQLVEGFKSTRIEMEKLQEATAKLTKQQELSSSFTSAGGNFGSLIDTFSGDSFSSAMSETASAVSEMGAMAGPVGYLVTEMTKIISSLDVVNKLMSLLSDSITPVLNDFLEPLLPVIATLSHALSKLIEIHLVPLYPRIQEISKALLFVVGCIDILISAVDDGMKWIIGNVQKAFYDIVNGIIDIVNKLPFVDIGHVSNGNAEDWSSIDVLGNIQDNWDELMTEIQAISDNTFGTWENTKSDVDFSKLDALLAAGLISEDQYNQRAKAKQAGLNWDTVGASMSGYVSANNHTTQVQAGAVSITINGANDSTEVQRQVYRALQDAGIAVAGQAI